MTEPDTKLTVAEFFERVEDSAPFIDYLGFEVIDIGYGRATAAMPHHPGFIRPGNRLSGPAMFSIADFCMWLAVLGAVGWVPMAVTTGMTINFLRKPDDARLIAEAKLFKVGRRLAVGEIWVRSEGAAEPCAHLTGTYSIPSH